MVFPFYIAKRYLLSKKSHNIINIISAISVVGVMVGTMALIVVLSVFNGFEDLVNSLYSTFDPDIKITIKEGKTFEANLIDREKIAGLTGVISFTEVIEENALVKHRAEQSIVSLKGVSNDFLVNNPLDSMLVDGDMILKREDQNYSIMGYLIAYNLGIRLYDPSNPILVYAPKRTKKTLSTLDQSFNTGSLMASAVFSVQQEIDSKYIIVPISFARKILEYGVNEVTAIEVRLGAGIEMDDVQEKISEISGEDFDVKNRFQQQVLLYKIMKSEKWAIFLILTFILIIAAFNTVGSLSMLILDKRKDISVLYSMGASQKQIKRIFQLEGLLVSLSGAILGLLLGFILCWVQIQFGLVRLGDANAFIVPYYPVKLIFMDFVWIFLTVLIIGVFAAWYPVRQLSSRYLNQRISDFTKN
jgi:lipoprotein-releasing system permease protein